MKAKITWFGKSNLRLENSFGVIAQEENISMEYTIGIIDDQRGYFELADLKTGGNDWYGEGGLWFDEKKVTDYDGCFSLPHEIVDELERMGYDVSEIKN